MLISIALGDEHRADPRGASRGVDIERLGTTNAGLAHAAGDNGRVRGLPAARGQYPVRRDDALEVIGVGFLADQHDLLAAFGPRLGGGRIEHRAADGGAR